MGGLILGWRVMGLEFEVKGVGLRIFRGLLKSFGFQVEGLRCRVWGLGFGELGVWGLWGPRFEVCLL